MNTLKHLGSQTATTATVGAVGALLGDLCAEDADCAALPGALCARGGCVCRPGYTPTAHRKACIGKYSIAVVNIFLLLFNYK